MMQGNASFPLATYGSLRLPRPPSGRAPAHGGGTPCLPVQPASWLRLGSARVLALAHRGMPRRAASSAAATSVAQRHSRAGDTPAPHGSLRLPRPPSGRAPAQGIPLASPYSPLAGCVSALPRTRSRSSLQASTCRPPRAAKVEPPFTPSRGSCRAKVRPASGPTLAGRHAASSALSPAMLRLRRYIAGDLGNFQHLPERLSL